MNTPFTRLPPMLRFAIAADMPLRPQPGPQPFAARPPIGMPPPSGGQGGSLSPQAMILRNHGMYLDAMFDRSSPDHRHAVSLLEELYASWPDLQSGRPHPVDGKKIEFTPSALMKCVSGTEEPAARTQKLTTLLERVVLTFDLDGTPAPARLREFCRLYLGRAARPSPQDRSSDEGSSLPEPPRTARGTEIVIDTALPFRETEPISSAPKTIRGTEILPPAPRVIHRPTQPLPPPRDTEVLPSAPKPSRALQAPVAREIRRGRIFSRLFSFGAYVMRWIRSLRG